MMGSIFLLVLVLAHGQNANAGFKLSEQWSLDSPHPYTLQSQQWLVERPNAAQIQVRFEYIRVWDPTDHVYVKDANLNIVNSFTGEHGSNTWSDWITGTKLYIVLVRGNPSVTCDGFRVMTVNTQWTNDIESIHPYTDGYDQYWAFNVKYASSIRIWYERIEVEPFWDLVRVYDYKGVQKWYYYGSGYDVWSDWIPGPMITVRLSANNNGICGYGLKVKEIWTCTDDDSKFEISILTLYTFSKLGNLPTTDLDTIKTGFLDMGWRIHQALSNSQVYDYNFYTDGDVGDLIFTSSHGEPALVTLYGHDDNNYPKSRQYFNSNDAKNHPMGDEDLEWIVFSACSVLDPRSWNNLRDFLTHGVHGIYGFYKDVGWNEGSLILPNFMKFLKRGLTFEDAWADACNSLSTGPVRGASEMCHASTWNDHLWGYGTVYPDPTTNNDIHWWLLT
jgi:hypothetical protein